MDHWKVIGIIATPIIVLSIPAYILKQRMIPDATEPAGGESGDRFVGSQKCESCHKTEYDSWKV